MLFTFVDHINYVLMGMLIVKKKHMVRLYSIKILYG